VGALAESFASSPVWASGREAKRSKDDPARRTNEVLLQTKCDSSRLLRIVLGDTLMRLPPNGSNVRRSRSVSSGLQAAEDGRGPASRARYVGR
jgi:hypothetical protein